MEKDRIMDVVKNLAEGSAMSLDDIGVRMGYPKETARKSAWQFINRTNDPRVSMLRKFCEAMEIEVNDLFVE